VQIYISLIFLGVLGVNLRIIEIEKPEKNVSSQA
jgi:hypothetical protein